MSAPDTTTEAHANKRPGNADDLPDYAPIPRPAFGPALNEQGYYEIAAANGVSNKVTYLIYSHHHADHAGAASLFDKNVGEGRSQGDAEAAGARQRPDQAPTGGDVRGPAQVHL
jgi:glyoxylase-like metal-dependent hydrolase (beta-lactamase superfamily II)